MKLPDGFEEHQKEWDRIEKEEISPMFKLSKLKGHSEILGLMISHKMNDFLKPFIEEKRIHNIRAKISDVAENGLKRHLYPKNTDESKEFIIGRGRIAERNWNNELFALGMEYGYIYKILEDNNLLDEE